MTTHDADGGSVDVAERLAVYIATSFPAPHHNQSLSLRLLYAEMVRLMERPERPALFGGEVQFASPLRREVDDRCDVSVAVPA